MLTDANSQWRRSIAFAIASRISRKNKKNKIIILFLTKYELCCVNDNDVDVLFVFVCFFYKKREETPFSLTEFNRSVGRVNKLPAVLSRDLARFGLFGEAEIWSHDSLPNLICKNLALNGSCTVLLVRTWHCYFISFNSEHPVVAKMSRD